MNLSQFMPEETTEIRRTTITTKIRTINKICSKDILPSFDVTLMMEMDTLQGIVPRTKTPLMRIIRDIMHVLPKAMYQQTKDSEEKRMIHMKSMC